jgi:hypothetical protein
MFNPPTESINSIMDLDTTINEEKDEEKKESFIHRGRSIELFTPKKNTDLSNINNKKESVLKLKSKTTIKSPTIHDPFFQDEKNFNINMKESNWVTVFGFPVNKTSYILKEFSNYGEIIDYNTSDGNWMNILFKTKFQKQKAIGKNGKIFDNKIMVGVVECFVDQNKNKKRKFSKISKDEYNPDDLILRNDENNENFENLFKKQKIPEKGGFFSNIFDYIFKF